MCWDESFILRVLYWNCYISLALLFGGWNWESRFPDGVIVEACAWNELLPASAAVTGSPSSLSVMRVLCQYILQRMHLCSLSVCAVLCRFVCFYLGFDVLEWREEDGG